MMVEAQKQEVPLSKEIEKATSLIFYDGGNPEELAQIQKLAHNRGEAIVGVTTNPTTIAAYLKEKHGQDFKTSKNKAVNFQKDVVLEMVNLVDGPISAEVYADGKTKAYEIIEQALEIASWHPNVVVKVPTTEPGMVATFELKKLGIKTNNTLVFSQEQALTISLIDRLTGAGSLSIISPFIGRLDDRGIRGIDLVENIMRTKREYSFTPKILEASVRNPDHIIRGREVGVDFITSPAGVLNDWFTNVAEEEIKKAQIPDTLTPIQYWQVPDRLLAISSFGELVGEIRSGGLNIHHQLTDAGLERFASDWLAIIRD